MVQPSSSTMKSNLLALEVSGGERAQPVLTGVLFRCLLCLKPPNPSEHLQQPPPPRFRVSIQGENCFWDVSFFQPPDQVLPSHPTLGMFPRKIQQKDKRKP